MRPTTTPHPTRRRALLVGLLLAVGVVALAACEPPPDPPAAKLFDAWKAGKPSQATGDFTTYAAKQQMFSQAWTSSAQWAFITRDGAAGSTYCTWVNRLEGRLVLRVDNASQKVTSVQRISLGNESAGRLFHGWRIGDVAGSGGVASPSVKANLAKETYKASDHWLPQGCVSSSPYVDCTWTNDAGKTVVFTYDPPFAWVVGYSGTYFA